MRERSLGLNAFLNGLRSILNLLFPLITFPYISRILSVQGIGNYNFSNNYVNYFILIAGLGIPTYAVREGAKYRDDKEKINNFSNQIFTINIVSTVIAYALLIISLLVFRNLSNYISCILIFSLQILFTTIGTEWIYTIYEDYSYITIRSIVFKIISIIFLFILVRKPEDYLWYATITVFAGVGSNILNFIHAKSFCDIKIVKNINWQYHLKPIMIIFATSVAVTIYVSSDTTILGLMKSDYAVGIYSTSVKIYSIAQSLLSAVLTVAIPRLAMLLGQHRMKEYSQILSNLINVLATFALPATVGLIMLSKEIIIIIAGYKFLPSVSSLKIISWAIIFSIFSWIFNQCVLIPARREDKSFRNTIVTAVVNIILNILLIPFYSYNGTSFSTVLAEFMVMCMNGYSARDIIKPIIFSKKNIKNWVSIVIGCVGIVIICLLCNWGWNSTLLKTCTSIILSIPLYFSILLVCKNDVAVSVLKKIANLKNDK